MLRLHLLRSVHLWHSHWLSMSRYRSCQMVAYSMVALLYCYSKTDLVSIGSSLLGLPGLDRLDSVLFVPCLPDTPDNSAVYWCMRLVLPRWSSCRYCYSYLWSLPRWSSLSCLGNLCSIWYSRSHHWHRHPTIRLHQNSMYMSLLLLLDSHWTLHIRLYISLSVLSNLRLAMVSPSLWPMRSLYTHSILSLLLCKWCLLLDSLWLLRSFVHLHSKHKFLRHSLLRLYCFHYRWFCCLPHWPLVLSHPAPHWYSLMLYSHSMYWSPLHNNCLTLIHYLCGL